MSVLRDSHPEDLRAELRKKFGTLQSFERRYGLPVNSAACALRRPYEAAEQAIAEALDRSAHEIWPSRYAPDGVRLDPQPARNYAPARGKPWIPLPAPEAFEEVR